MQHLDACGLRTLRPGYGAITAGTQMCVFFWPTGLAKLGYVTSPSVPQLLTLNLAFSREMSSNVSFPTKYGASPKMEKWTWQFSASTLLSWKREVWTHFLHLDRHHQGKISFPQLPKAIGYVDHAGYPPFFGKPKRTKGWFFKRPNAFGSTEITKFELSK